MSAADMSKRAMIRVHNDPELQRLGFRMQLAVHDELIGECPEENKEAVADRLCEVMKHAAEPNVTVPFKCDPTIENCWYYTDYADVLNKTYHAKLEKEGKSVQEALLELYEENCECTPEQIREMLTIS